MNAVTVVNYSTSLQAAGKASPAAASLDGISYQGKAANRPRLRAGFQGKTLNQATPNRYMTVSPARKASRALGYAGPCRALPRVPPSRLQRQTQSGIRRSGQVGLPCHSPAREDRQAENALEQVKSSRRSHLGGTRASHPQVARKSLPGDWTGVKGSGILTWAIPATTRLPPTTSRMSRTARVYARQATVKQGWSKSGIHGSNLLEDGWVVLVPYNPLIQGFVTGPIRTWPGIIERIL